MIKFSQFTTCVLAGAYCSSALAVTNLSLPNEPLSVLSSRVQPNVMLVMDNSGSMRNIIWADGYDPDVEYPRWDDKIRRDNHNYYDEGSEWNKNSGNVDLGDLRHDNCDDEFGSGFYEAVRKEDVTDRKCLALPDPFGNENTRYTGNYLNYLFETFPSGTDLRDGSKIPIEYRMQVARNVAKSVVDSVENIRYGVTIFYSSQGGKVINECRDYIGNKQAVMNALDSITARTNTPISEAYYEVTRYFRGMSSMWTNGGSFTSPIEYRCQRNFSILITDGEPTRDSFEDRTLHTSDIIEGKDNRLPDWNGDEAKYYLDDIALFARELDMRTSGLDKEGKSFDDPEFKQQNMNTYTVGFALDHELLKSTAALGKGQYYTANNAEQLATALRSALSDISDKVLSVSSAAVSQGPLNAGTLTVFPKYNSGNWTGDLSAYRFDSDPTSSTYLQLVPEWTSAAAKIEQTGWRNRRIITNLNGSGVPFRWGSFSGQQQNDFFQGKQSLLQYLRGDQADEGSAYRERAKLLGDIVYSSPQYVGAPSFRYENTEYQRFKKDHADREPVIYVGANDGMLHGFKASTGEELLAYVPGSLNGHLAALADQDYSHRFYVDGTPTVVDAQVNSRWRTVLVGGLGRGGQSIYALDVTDPTRFTEGAARNVFLWEFMDPDLGYSYSRPAVVQLENGQWVAVFGNGYNSTDDRFDSTSSSDGDAVLFVLDLASGTLLQKIDTGVGYAEDPTGQTRPNGLGTVKPIDTDGNGMADTIYAGDLFGNLWKFDLTGNSASSWKVAGNAPIFKACQGDSCSANTVQPITSAPTVGRHPMGGVMVYFGTGKYLETTDKSDNGTLQSLYGIWDQPSKNGGGNNGGGNKGGGNKGGGNNAQGTVSRADLLEQTITYEGRATFDGESYNLRLTSQNEPDWTVHKGWYLDLNKSSSERVVAGATLRNGKIIFTTFTPLTDDSDMCKSDAVTWLMEMDAVTGGALEYASFDLDGDLDFDESDWIDPGNGGGKAPPSGIQMDGEKPHPSIVPVDPEKEIKVLDESTIIVENPGPHLEGRISWRELL
ncbi:type IV pilus assembly protein PilY1 [Marinobacterium halophilum]|uniref:Type IV pilus assembly protein PilY1 n=1 Tax=Marinobacterium halophilum TaxID=267374 RepID=A0A2P8F2A9_9GAMM|nr:PilC/PilY family type IV pilus protein [Marinobacterium halophilum]PSL15847.1 type IV pilus assembly protein PilY1 [Marinobacterium halophilum]